MVGPSAFVLVTLWEICALTRIFNSDTDEEEEKLVKKEKRKESLCASRVAKKTLGTREATALCGCSACRTQQELQTRRPRPWPLRASQAAAVWTGQNPESSVPTGPWLGLSELAIQT